MAHKRPPATEPEHEYCWRHIPEPLWLRAKAKAAIEKVDMQDVLRLLLEAWVDTPS